MAALVGALTQHTLAALVGALTQDTLAALVVSWALLLTHTPVHTRIPHTFAHNVRATSTGPTARIPGVFE